MVSSILGSFGSSLRETRMTAMLGYLIALAPTEFAALFGIRGKVLSIILEANHEQDRSDIQILTTEGALVIEAKRDAADPLPQVVKYPALKHILLTNFRPGKRERGLKRVRYVNWSQVALTLGRLAQSQSGITKFLSQDFKNYLEEHRLIRSKDSVEIYAREINEEITLNLFLKARMYVCDYQRGSRLPEALYFAPHFGKSIAYTHPGVNPGISYVARIENIEVVDGWEQLLQATASFRSKPWLKKHIGYLEGIHRIWKWEGEKRSILYLGEPRLVFNPPVKKENLQAGKGWLSKRTFSFDDLFHGWGK
jgi:hypothetical protein